MQAADGIQQIERGGLARLSDGYDAFLQFPLGQQRGAVCSWQQSARQRRRNPYPVQHAGHIGANDSGFGTHFRVRIASPFFTGKTRVACHRLVYDAAQDFIDQGLHALAIEIDTAS